MNHTNGNIPRHRAVYESIRKNIEDNNYPSESLLPSENEMCVLFEVTRPTIRQALTRLENDGFIKRHQGKGSIVQKVHNRLGILSIEGVTEVLGSLGVLSSKILKAPSVGVWPKDFKFKLTDDEKSLGCIYLERVRLIDNHPVILEKIYLVNIHLPRFCQKKYETRSLFGTLRKDYDIEIKDGEQKIKALASDKKTAKLLKIKDGQAILHLQGILNTSSPSLRIFSETLCSTERFYLYGSF